MFLYCERGLSLDGSGGRTGWDEVTFCMRFSFLCELASALTLRYVLGTQPSCGYHVNPCHASQWLVGWWGWGRQLLPIHCPLPSHSLWAMKWKREEIWWWWGVCDSCFAFIRLMYHLHSDGFRTHYPKIWRLGILTISSWRNLRNGRGRKDFPTFPWGRSWDPRVRGDPLRLDDRSILICKGWGIPRGIWKNRPGCCP